LMPANIFTKAATQHRRKRKRIDKNCH